jgi:hypothetical protein
VAKWQMQRAPGEDGICAELIHGLYQPMLHIILQLVNQIWESRELPSSFLCSIVLPFLKDGKPPEQCNSYHPIALTSILGKLIECLVVTCLCY